MPESTRHTRLAFAALVASNIFLAFGPWMVRLADTGPVAAGFWRTALAAPLLALLAARAGGASATRASRATLIAIAVGGLFFAADLASWHYGILRTKLANATLFGNVSSFLFPIYGFFAFRAFPRPTQIAALLLALFGAGLLLGRSYELSPAHLQGDLFTILAGVFYTGYLIVVERARRAVAPMPVLALSTIAGVAPLLIFALMLGEQVMPHKWTALILLALGSQVIGQGLLVYAMGHLRPLVVGIAFLLQPVVTAIIGWLVYAESLSAADGIGAAFICAAMVLIRLPGRAAPD